MTNAETLGAVERERERERAIFYRTWNLQTWKANSTEKITQDGIVSSENLGFVLVQKIYIKYKNLKDGLCIKIARPFCVQKGVIDTG